VRLPRSAGQSPLLARHPGLGEHLAQGSLDPALALPLGQLARGWGSHDKLVVAFAVVAGYRPEGLTQQSLHAVAVNCPADLAWNGHAETRRLITAARKNVKN